MMTPLHNENPFRIELLIEKLLVYARSCGLIEEADVIPVRNALLDLFRLSKPASPEQIAAVWSGSTPHSAVLIVEPMLDYAAQNMLMPEDNMTYRDLFDARIMGHVMPRASETNRKFYELAGRSVREATDYFYKQSVDSNYIRLDRVARNEYWLADTPYGQLEMTINLSKPEKDPREIALVRNAASIDYPRCLLCADNVGYSGRTNHPARQNHRVIPIQLDGERWFFQYSPYVYYNEHSIVLSEEHRPMRIDTATFRRLFEFVEQFPHYFIGSNADLPIVGGSILNHDHFQAGRHTFPMEIAPIEASLRPNKYPEVEAGIVAWPLSVVRLASSYKEALLSAAGEILEQWRNYSDPALGIIARSERDGVLAMHNTITPIVRRRKTGQIEIDLVLRNNRTDEAHPEGIFHPHRYLHHIKQENIGLIEVMGLSVLPGRLKAELQAIGDILTGERPFERAAIAHDDPLGKHANWIGELTTRYGTANKHDEAYRLLKLEVGSKFREVLDHCGVYKRDANGREGFIQFLHQSGFKWIK